MWKIIDRYILKGFIPIFLMAFVVAWFIFVMQFMWRYIDELVGKGLGVWVLLKIIYYAAMSLVPMALPLGILLASLIFFGNIGERLELLAIKAAGISLYRVLAPLFAVVLSLSIGLFIFLNSYMITCQVRMWTLVYTAKGAALELEIPEGTFYNGIPDYSIFIKERDKQHKGRMNEVMIYAFNGATHKTQIIRADSGRLVMNKDKTFITFRLYRGQSFQNLEENVDYRSEKPIPHARERFAYKEILIPFDANIKLEDDKNFSSLYVGRNLNQLDRAIDSAKYLVDSIRTESSQNLSNQSLSQRYNQTFSSTEVDSTATKPKTELSELEFKTKELSYNPDSLFRQLNVKDSLRIVRQASSYLSYMRSDASNSLYLDENAYRSFRTNSQEWHRKFTFPVACIVFFLIGAPLGAIVRKGGIGMPILISVIFFIIYYTIDTFGYNMISREVISVQLGMWLNTMILLPIGIFLTFQAARDSSILNGDAYRNFFEKLLGLKKQRKYIYKEVIIKEADYEQGLIEVQDLKGKVVESLHSDLMQEGIWRLWFSLKKDRLLIDEISDDVESLVEHLSNTTDIMLNAHLRDLPVLPKNFAWFLPNNRILVFLLALILPISVPPALILKKQCKERKNALNRINDLLNKIKDTLEKKIDSPEEGKNDSI